MTEKRQFRAIKGTRDILPPDSALWNWFEQTAREVFESYGFRDIRLPIFEQTDLFARSVGEDTDIVSKEMFTFTTGESDLLNLRDIHSSKYPHEPWQPVRLYRLGYRRWHGFAVRLSARWQCRRSRPPGVVHQIALQSVVRRLLPGPKHHLARLAKSDQASNRVACGRRQRRASRGHISSTGCKHCRVT